MSHFQFRMQSVLRLRERDRDVAAQALQQAHHAKQILVDQITGWENEIDQLNQMRGSASQGHVDINQLLDAQRYQLNLLDHIRGAQVNIGLIDQEIEKRRAKLVLCEQGVKALEKLRENQLSTWTAEQHARSQSRLDEWASFKHFQRNAES